jgi:hypothetical protein
MRTASHELEFTDCDLPLAGQRLVVAPGRYDWVYLVLAGVASGDRGAVEEILWLRYQSGLDPEFLRSLPAARWPGNGVLARAGVPRREELTAVHLPIRPGLRVTGIGLAAAWSGSLTSTGGP